MYTYTYNYIHTLKSLIYIKYIIVIYTDIEFSCITNLVSPCVVRFKHAYNHITLSTY